MLDVQVKTIIANVRFRKIIKISMQEEAVRRLPPSLRLPPRGVFITQKSAVSIGGKSGMILLVGDQNKEG